VLGAGIQAMDRIASAFAQESENVTKMSSVAAYKGLRDRAAHSADVVFGDQLRDLKAQKAANTDAEVAKAFESWVTTSQFIPLYVAEMDRFWREKEEVGEELTVPLTPTSPHKLAKRAQLGRVRMKELTLKVPGRALDEALVKLVAGRFRDEVRSAYAKGKRRFKELEQLTLENERPKAKVTHG
jgi:hypothetical protein